MRALGLGNREVVCAGGRASVRARTSVCDCMSACCVQTCASVAHLALNVWQHLLFVVDATSIMPAESDSLASLARLAPWVQTRRYRSYPSEVLCLGACLAAARVGKHINMSPIASTLRRVCLGARGRPNCKLIAGSSKVDGLRCNMPNILAAPAPEVAPGGRLRCFR